MLKSTLTVLALTGAPSAANSTISLWLIGSDQQTVLGSVIASPVAIQTTAVFPHPSLLPQGPSTVAYSYVEDDTAATETVNLGCVVTDSASGVCSVTINAVSVLSSVTTTSVTDASDLGLQAVTLTARAAVSNTAASMTETSATGSIKLSAASASKSYSGSASASAASASGTTASDSKNGGLPMVTQAPFFIGAMAAGMAFVAM